MPNGTVRADHMSEWKRIRGTVAVAVASNRNACGDSPCDATRSTAALAVSAVATTVASSASESSTGVSVNTAAKRRMRSEMARGRPGRVSWSGTS